MRPIRELSGLAGITPTGVCTTAIGTAAKVVTIGDGTYIPQPNDLIMVKFTNGNSIAAMTLNVNSSGAKNILLNGANTNTTTASLVAGAVLLLYCDGTYYHMMGSQRTSDSNTDTYDRMYWGITFTAGLAIYDYKILMMGVDGKLYPLTLETGTGTTKTVLTTELLLNGLILYYPTTTDIAANGALTNLYSEMNMTTLVYTANQASWTSQKPIYLKGTITAAGNFKLDNTTPTSFMTQTLPTTEDGFVYILLGYMYGTTSMRLTAVHPIYQYAQGSLRQYLPTHTHPSGPSGAVITVSASAPGSPAAGDFWYQVV